MIVTYCTSLRSGGKTIATPPFESTRSEELLNHIQTHCLEDCNRDLPGYDYADLSDIIILFLHP